ncbi:cell wall-binding protein, partial [Bifidobacterium sp. DSM 109963]|nr:cell wall-binding protein [Bifidobacterium sp. DSM 109963]
MDRVAGRPVWRCVCAVIAVVATVLAVMVTPMARAAETEVSSWDGALAALAGDADTVTYTVSADAKPGATLTVPAGKTLVVKGSASLTGGTSGEPLFEVADGGHLVLDGVTLTGNTVGDKGAVYVAKGGVLELGSDSATAAAPSITGNTNAGSACNLVVEKDSKVYLNASPDKPIGLSYSGTVEAPVSLVMSGRHTIQSTDVAAGKIAADSTGQATVTANGCVLVRSATPKILYWSPNGYFGRDTDTLGDEGQLTARQNSTWNVASNRFNGLGDLTVIHGTKTVRKTFVGANELNNLSLDQFDFIYVEPSRTQVDGSYYTDAEIKALLSFLDSGGRVFIQCEDVNFNAVENTPGSKLAQALNTDFQVLSAPMLPGGTNATPTTSRKDSAVAAALTENLPDTWKINASSPISYDPAKGGKEIFTATYNGTNYPVCVDLQAGSTEDATPWGNVTIMTDGDIWQGRWNGTNGTTLATTTQFAKNLLNTSVESRDIAATGANPNERFVVTFNSNGGSAVDSETVLKGSKVSEPEAPTWVGHALVGWYSDASLADDTKWNFDTSTMPGENLTLYAKWTTEASYTVKHYLQNVDGSYPSDPTATETLKGTIGQDTAAVAKTTYTGFTPVAFDQVEVKADGSTEVVVKYTRNEYTVKFDKNGGTGDMADQSFKYGEDEKALSTNLFKRAGYEFTGWKDKDDSTKTYTDGQAVQNLTAVDGGTVTLLAQWGPNTDTAYTVEHYLQNVDNDEYTLQSEDTETKQGTTDTETKAEAKTTYTGFAAKDFSQENISGDGKTVVKIYYTRDKHDVTFDAKGHGTTPDKQESVKYGAKVKNPGDLS